MSDPQHHTRPPRTATGLDAAVRERLDQFQADGARPELRAALAPYLDACDGDPVRAVRELMTDLRSLAGHADVDAAAARTGPIRRFRPAPASKAVRHE